MERIYNNDYHPVTAKQHVSNTYNLEVGGVSDAVDWEGLCEKLIEENKRLDAMVLALLTSLDTLTNKQTS